jgi:hypothetical protein
MGINKIKLKQIDADFSGLVGAYGSGYFASTGSLNALSGQSVKYSDLLTGRFVYSTGNQDISGIKNFLAKPTLSGEALARLSEVVTLDGDETINGFKDFSSDVIFHGNVSHELGDLSFTQNSFIFDPLSLNNFANSVSTELVTVKTTQIITGVKTFTNGIRVGGNGGSGVLHSGQINPIYVSGVSSNLDRYIIFAEGTGSGFKNAQMESGLNYNPSTKILKASIFSGNLSGNAASAATATNASNVSLAFDTTAGTYFLPFSKTSNATTNALFIDSTLSYDPSTSTLTVTNFDGNASNATNASSVSLISDNTNGTYFLPFSKTANATQNALFVDNSVTPLSYNPSTSRLSASTFAGAFAGNSLNATSSTALNIGTFASTDSINFNFPAGTSSYTMTSGAFFPSITGRTLGNSTNRWGAVFAVNSAIQTSDRNLKTEISEIPDLWLDAWQDVNYVKYKFKDAVALKGISGARWHLGHIAQDIYEAFDRRGLDAFEIGMLCYDSWGESVDQNGNIVPSGEIWSIRPDECQFMELALMRRSIDRLKSGILI